MQVVKVVKPSRIKKLTYFTFGFAFSYQFLFTGQQKANVRAAFKGATNGALAFPSVGFCVYDYISSLRGLQYPSQEYIDARSECHKRTARKLLSLSTHCGGVYFKAGQYIGSLEKIAPKEYCDQLKKL